MFIVFCRERIVAYKCAADKAKCESMILRERLMSQFRAHYDLNLELAQQRSLAKSLSQELQMVKLAANNNNKGKFILFHLRLSVIAVCFYKDLK